MKTFITLTLSFSIFISAAFAGQDREPGPNKVGLKAPAATISVTELDGVTLTTTDLVEAILGPGVSYSNVNFAGTQAPAVPASAGTYINGNQAGLEIDQGIMLSSGFVLNAPGPNISGSISGGLGTGGDPDLDALVGGGTQDRTVLEFDFIPTKNTIFIEYEFGSDEYNEWVGSGFNDVFAFLVNGTNIALIPTTNIPVAINNVNLGSFPQYYVNNSPAVYDIEADGFTTKFVGEATVIPNQVNHIKIAIADRGDNAFDSWVFIKAGSFSTNNPNVPVSPWALFIGIGLIVAFTLIRFRRLS